MANKGTATTTPPLALVRDGPQAAPLTLVLAHGAGAAMDTTFMETVAEGVAARGVAVARFEFPYMRIRRAGGGRRPPDREPVLLDAWREAIGLLGGGGALAIGGKSLGGRMATKIADEAGVRGVVCLGYPFHPPGRPEKLRVEHLRGLTTPTLIVQGTRDPFGTADEVAGYGLPPTVRTVWIADGDHSLKPRKVSGRTEARNLADAVAAIAGFLAEIGARTTTA